MEFKSCSYCSAFGHFISCLKKNPNSGINEKNNIYDILLRRSHRELFNGIL